EKTARCERLAQIVSEFSSGWSHRVPSQAEAHDVDRRQCFTDRQNGDPCPVITECRSWHCVVDGVAMTVSNQPTNELIGMRTVDDARLDLAGEEEIEEIFARMRQVQKDERFVGKFRKAYIRTLGKRVLG